jgi:preprotein translocase subunit SecG
MAFVIGFLTLAMLVDCVVLVLLVLIQLPKKEAGAGLAFGGATSDALFGAGSGNVLTKITKYAATTFFILAVGLSILQGNYHRRTTTGFQQKLEQPSRAPNLPPATSPGTPTPTSSVPLTSFSTNTSVPSPQVEATTNPPAAAAPSSAPTNSAPQK